MCSSDLLSLMRLMLVMLSIMDCCSLIDCFDCVGGMAPTRADFSDSCPIIIHYEVSSTKRLLFHFEVFSNFEIIFFSRSGKLLIIVGYYGTPLFSNLCFCASLIKSRPRSCHPSDQSAVKITSQIRGVEDHPPKQ
mgnify:CR=1 FL=1